MAVYKNIINTSDNTLITKTSYSGPQQGGIISSIHISNNKEAIDTPLDLWLEDYNDGSVKHYFTKNLVIPKGVSLVLDDNLSFDIKKYKLVVNANDGANNPDLTIIIK